MSAYVVDATVATKWLVPEDGTEAALGYRTEILIAPDLLLSECANALWKKAARGEITGDYALAAVLLLEKAQMEIVPALPHMPDALRLALALRHPVYDCLYLAIASARRLPLLTADRRLTRRVTEAKAVHGMPEVVPL